VGVGEGVGVGVGFFTGGSFPPAFHRA